MRRFFAITLAIGATSIVWPAFGGEPVPATPVVAATAAVAPESGPAAFAGLPVRPSRPLTLADASQDKGSLAKLIGGAVIIAGAAIALHFRKRRPSKKGAPEVASLRIMKRAGIGVRSELLIVEADGQQLLLGVTPQNISLIANLGTHDLREAAPEPAAADERHAFRHVDDEMPAIPRDQPNQGERFAALLRATGVDRDTRNTRHPREAADARDARESRDTRASSMPDARYQHRDSTPPSAARTTTRRTAADRARDFEDRRALPAPRTSGRSSIVDEGELEGQVRSLATWAPRR